MRKPLLFTILALGAGSLAAQISITSTNVPVSGDTIRVTDVNIATLPSYTATGANMVWQFDSVKATGQSMRDFKGPVAAGYMFGISSSDYGEKVADSIPIPGIITLKNVYNFYRKNGTTSFNLDAIGMTMQGFGVPNTFSDKDEMYFFPLNYGDRDSSTFKFSTFTYSAIPFVYKKEGYRITEADGWGTVSTPYGQTQCLRVTTTQYSIDTLKAMLPIFGFTVPINIGFPNYQRSIQWLTLTERIPFMEISGTVTSLGGGEVFLPTTARYRDIKREFVGIKEQEGQIAVSVYPNPVVNELNIVIPLSKNNTLEVFSATGQLVMKKELINTSAVNKHSVDVSGLGAGSYLGRLSNGSTVQNFKFTKQ